MNKKELWLTIANYQFENLAPTHLWDHIAAQFGGGSPFVKAFASKISRKHNWNNKFALKAIWEYKKFVYLGVTSNFSVTPSKVIDQVWHEHLLFSAGYRKFCKEIIKYDFDHNPELISSDHQTEKYCSQYLNTVALYFKEFGHEPPNEIWDLTKFKMNINDIKKQGHNRKGLDYSDNYWETDSLVSMFNVVEINSFQFGGGQFGGSGAGGSWGFDKLIDDEDSEDSGDNCSSCSSSCGGD
jgi:hypothetical protein